MLTKEFRIEENVVVIAANEEEQTLSIIVNGDVLKSGHLREEVTPEAAIADFNEEVAKAALFDFQTATYFDTPHDYVSVKTFETFNGGFELSAMAESEGQRFMAFQLRDHSGDLVYQTRKELADASSVQDALDGFTQEVADNITMQVLFTGRW